MTVTTRRGRGKARATLELIEACRQMIAAPVIGELLATYFARLIR
ncbi:MAG: hypothetical protein U1E86_06395 [Burkholderiaceae bacterium]